MDGEAAGMDLGEGAGEDGGAAVAEGMVVENIGGHAG